MTTQPEKLKILIVEDEDSKLQQWQQTIDYHNADAVNLGYRIESTATKTVSDAKVLLDRYSFDAAIIDLRLQKEDGVSENNDHGNHLVEYIVETQPMGIAIHTGQQSDAVIPPSAGSQVKVLDKGDGLDNVIRWLSDNKEVFLRLRGAKSILNKEAAHLFFRSIWPRWRNWTEIQDEGVLNTLVARHVAAHIHDSLLTASNDAAHSEEAYFAPPVKSRLDTGDLISIKYIEKVKVEGEVQEQEKEKVWIVVTPRCDLARLEKIKTVILAGCEDFSESWNKDCEKPQSAGAKDRINKARQHRGSHKLHFLFPLVDGEGKQHGPWMVNFDDLMPVPVGEMESLIKDRFASLSPLFVPSLVERLGSYFSRIGTPDHSSE